MPGYNKGNDAVLLADRKPPMTKLEIMGATLFQFAIPVRGS